MKKVIIILVYTIFINFSFGQTNSIVGAWYWSDATIAVSFSFKKDSSCSIHSGPRGEAILSKNTKKGTYTYSGTELIIKWQNAVVETNTLKFIDDNTIEITLADKEKKKQKKRVLVFSRIVDEEATFEK